MSDTGCSSGVRRSGRADGIETRRATSPAFARDLTADPVYSWRVQQPTTDGETPEPTERTPPAGRPVVVAAAGSAARPAARGGRPWLLAFLARAAPARQARGGRCPDATCRPAKDALSRSNGSTRPAPSSRVRAPTSTRRTPSAHGSAPTSGPSYRWPAAPSTTRATSSTPCPRRPRSPSSGSSSTRWCPATPPRLVQGQASTWRCSTRSSSAPAAIGTHLDAAVDRPRRRWTASTPVVGGVGRARQGLRARLPAARCRTTYARAGPLVEALPSTASAPTVAATYLLAMLNPAEQRYSGGGALSFTSVTFDHGQGGLRRHGHHRRRHPRRASPRPGGRWSATSSTRAARCGSSTRRSRPGGRSRARSCCAATRRRSPASGTTVSSASTCRRWPSLFRITGPVQLEHFGTISADNLVSTVAGSYDKFSSTAERKQLNAELVPAFRDKFFGGGQMQAKVKSLVDAADCAPLLRLLPRPHGSSVASPRSGCRAT